MDEQFAFDFSLAAPPPGPAVAEQAASPANANQEVPDRPQVPGGNKRASRLQGLTPLPPERRPETLRACLEVVTRELGAADPEVKELAGAVRTVLKVVFRKKILDSTEDLPAQPVALRPHLHGAMPAAIRLSRSRFDNSKSHLKTLLIAVGWISRHSRSSDPVSEFWTARLGRTGRAEPAGPLLPFFRFCERMRIEADRIDVATVETYEAWLAAETLDLRPRHTANAVATAWRRMQKLRPNWPRQEIRLGSKLRHKALPLSAFPPSFCADLEDYLASLRVPKPLDPDQRRPLAEISIRSARYALMRAATFLAGSGVPLGDIKGLATLVEPKAFRAIAEEMHRDGLPRLEAAQESAQWTRLAYDIAGILVQAARRWVKPSPAALEEILAMQKLIRPRLAGLSERVQASLAELLTDEDRAELYALPWRAFEAADEMLRHGDPRRAAKLHETALALAIVLLHVLRIGDLAALDSKLHFVRDRRGQVTQLAVRSHKTRVIQRAELDPDLVARITWHFNEFRPHIPGHDSASALFPGRAGATRTPQALGKQMRKLVAEQLGKRFTAHLARHLLVDITLDDDPRNLEVAQRLLAHRQASTTRKIYGARVTLAGSRHFAATLREQAKRAGAPSPGERSRRRRKVSK